MKNYYLFRAEQLHQKDQTLEVVLDDGSKRSLPVEQIDELYVFTTMTLTTKVLELLSRHETAVHLFNYHEFYVGSFLPREHNISGKVLVEQVKAMESEKRMIFAKAFVYSSLTNIRRNLVYYQNKRENLAVSIDYIDEMIKKVAKASGVKMLMGYEGNARKKYYSQWGEILNDYDLKKRVRRPPTDIVNVLLSFYNSMLYTTCLSEIYKTQLNPAISYLHEVGRKKYALSLDLSEVFKPLIVDRLIFKILNKKMITEDDFINKSGVLTLKEKAVKKLLKLYDEEIHRTIVVKKLGRKVSYQTLIKLECYKIIKYLVEDEPYEPFMLEW